MPDPMRPHGSAPTLVKIYTDSGAAVNLKKSVCSKMMAATILQSQLTTRRGVVIGFIADITWVLIMFSFTYLDTNVRLA
jgi:hypothetical protein